MEETKQPQPRYTVATITTKDASLYNLAQLVMNLGYTQEAIFTRGIHVIIDEERKKEEKSQ